MTTVLSLLDQTELLTLAANAGNDNDPGAALGYLKEAASRPDASGLAHYMLGAEYAENKLYDRAADELEAALALDPTLHIARFQLGLLWLTGGVADKASSVLTPLDELAEDDPLRLFGQGLRHLMVDQFAEAEQCLAAGMAANQSNAALNGDMQQLRDAIAVQVAANEAAANGQAATPAPAPEPAPQDSAADDEQARRVLLSAYTGNTTH